MHSTGAGSSINRAGCPVDGVPLWERFENIALAATVLGWTVADLARVWPEWQPALIGIALIKLLVGGLLIVRGRQRRRGSPMAWLAAAPSLAIAYVAFRLATPPDQWPWWCVAMFLAGCTLTLAALLTLGTSFSVFPAVRAIVRGGLYRVVRHPAYLGQLILVAACCFASESWWGVLPLAIGLPLIAIRIHVEEQLLMTTPEYVDYAEQVRWRLMPGVW